MRHEQADNIDAAQAPDIRLGILDDFVGMLLRAAYDAAFEDFAGLLGSDSLKPGFFTILTLIAENPGITQVEIGRVARRDKSSVTKALRQLEDAGLIRRIRVEADRRSYASTLTPGGRQLQARMEAVARTHIDRLDAAIGPARKAEFLATLKDVIETLSNDPQAGASG